MLIARSIEIQTVFLTASLLVCSFGYGQDAADQDEPKRSPDTSAPAEETLEQHSEKIERWMLEGEFEKALSESNKLLSRIERLPKTPAPFLVELKLEIAQLEAIIKLAPEVQDEVISVLQWLKIKDDNSWRNPDGDSLEYAKEKHEQIRRAIGESHPLVVDAKLRISRVLHFQLQYQQEISLLRQCISEYESLLGQYHADTIWCKSRLADSYYWMGDFQQANTIMNGCVEDIRQYDCPLQLSTQILMGSAKIQARLGLFSDAEEKYRSLKTELVEAGEQDSFVYANCLLLLGHMLLSKPEPAAAQSELIEALEYFEKTQPPGNPFRITTRNTLAGCYYRLRQLDQSKELYKKSLQECEAHLPTTHPSRAACLSWLGKIAAERGDFVTQKACFEKSYRLMVDSFGEEHPETQTSIVDLAALNHDSGNYSKAEQLYRRAINVLDASSSSPRVRFVTSLEYASRLLEMGKLDLAQQQLLKCRELQASFDLSRWSLIRVQFLEAEIALSKGLVAEAKRAVQSAKKEWLDNSFSGYLQVRSLRLQGDVALAEGDLEAAHEFYKKSLNLSVSDQRRFAAVTSFASHKNLKLEQQGLFDRYCSTAILLLEEDDTDLQQFYDQVIQYKGMLTHRQRLKRKASSNDELQAMLFELSNLNSAIAKKMSRERNTDAVLPLVRKKNEIEQRVAELLKLERFEPEIRYQQVVDSLKENEVFLDFLCCQINQIRTLSVFVVRKNKPLKLIPLGDAAPLINDSLAWSKGQGESVAAQRAGINLRNALWKPINKYVDKNSDLIVSPDGAIGLISFAALPAVEAGKFLVEDHTFSYQISARSLVSSRNNRGDSDVGPKLLAIGDPIVGEDSGSESERTFVSLPAAVREIKAVKKLFDSASPSNRSTSFIRADASVKSLIESANSHTHIHIATHGFWNGEELDTQRPQLDFGRFGNTISGCLVGLVFGGQKSESDQDRLQFLTADDIANLDLSNVDQVVLSGCNTGRGVCESAEATASMQRAFHVSGAKTVVASMWNVPDAATSRLMVQYYKNIFESGMTKAKALQQAQIALLKNESPGESARNRSAKRSPSSKKSSQIRLRSPYQWGGFILSGDNF